MKVLVVYPKRDPRSPVRSQYNWNTFFDLIYWPFRPRSTGLYVNVLDALASLAPPGIVVRTVNEHLEEIDFEADVDLVAISCMVTHATRAYEIADEFRKRGRQVVLGGYHPFMLHRFGGEDEVLAHADAICVSEGDHIWAEILEDARRHRLRRVYKQEQPTDMHAVEHRLMTPPRHWLRHLYMTIQASRGCPFHCNFCSIVLMLGNRMRYKTPEAIAKELEDIYRRDLLGRTLGRPIFFVDDNIYGEPRRFKQILRAIVALNARYPRFRPYFGCQVTINIAEDAEALALLRDAGFFQVFIGLESLEPAVLRSYEKPHNAAFDYDRAIQTLRRHGIEVVASFIFGQDQDTAATFDAVFDFFQRNDIIYPYCNVLVPNQAQWLAYDEAGRILTREWKLYDAQHTVFVPARLRPIELQKGYIALMDRVFDYRNIRKRLIGAYIEGGARQVRLPYPLQLALYLKTLLALAVRRDRESYRFVQSLRSHILSNRLSVLNVLFQIDQHDFARRNHASLAEHPYDLDVPSWRERREAVAASAGAVPEPVSGAAS